MPSPEDERATAAGYDRWAACYDDHDPSTWLDEPFLVQHLKPFPGCRILDVGCGTGRYLRLIPPSAYRITGVDLSRNMLARAYRQIKDRTDISLVQSSAGCLPFKPRSFDRIMCGLVIDHMASAVQWFRELFTLLTMQGRAVVAGVHPDMQRLTGWDIDIQPGKEPAISIPGHIHEVEHLLAAAREEGFSVEAMEEPRVTAAMVEHRPAWRKKLGCPALLLLALAPSRGHR
jgi:ubiquinone/menaquinone biosynthesis C-methylase UbiE